ncbi:MAG: hypothetical protein ACK41T_09680 [Pseudobdellovibrio sp.]
MNIYFENFLKKTFLSAHIRVLEGISLQIKSGISPVKASNLIFKTLTSREKLVFEQLNHMQLDEKVPIYAHKFSLNYFLELNFIFRSNTRVSDQIDQFKKSLRVQTNLRHKSRLSTLQVRAQACVAVVIYAVLFGFSYSELGLADFPSVIFMSLVLMAVGVWMILFKGSKIKWTI